jgi:hypothetical protein
MPKGVPIEKSHSRADQKCSFSHGSQLFPKLRRGGKQALKS